MENKNIPTVFIIFGATGDLMAKKITPALFHLYKSGKFPHLFKIIAFSRRDLTIDEYQKHIRSILSNTKDRRIKVSEVESFLKYFEYRQGDFENVDAYNELASYLGRVDDEWKACSNKLFYLAVPPNNYQSIFEHLHASGLTLPCSPEEGWTRVIVEKPFGKDAHTAHELDELLGKLFKEEQIYRIDHYLGKDMMQNIISFRFSNDLFEKTWSKEHIDKIEIRLLEKIGVEGRGGFYDGIGALRDVGQNHALQMLALLTMKQPKDLTPENVRRARAKVLEDLIPLSMREATERTFRAQFKGYRDEEGVSKNSKTETYFKLIATLNSSQWEGVPIIIEAGKRIIESKEIVVTFKHTEPCLCPPGMHFKNKIVFSLSPREGISVEFWSKKPGLEYEMEKQRLSFLYRDERKRRAQYVEEYEKLLLDCILGNQLLFVSTDEVQAMWNFIDPIIDAWDKNAQPLHEYKPGTKKIVTDSMIIEKNILQLRT